MLLRLIAAAACLSGGAWLLFYAERAQKHLTHWRDQYKRTHRASNLFLSVTSQNYELPLRLVGAVLMALSIALMALALDEPPQRR